MFYIYPKPEFGQTYFNKLKPGEYLLRESSIDGMITVDLKMSKGNCRSCRFKYDSEAIRWDCLSGNSQKANEKVQKGEVKYDKMGSKKLTDAEYAVAITSLLQTVDKDIAKPSNLKIHRPTSLDRSIESGYVFFKETFSRKIPLSIFEQMECVNAYELQPGKKYVLGTSKNLGVDDEGYDKGLFYRKGKFYGLVSTVWLSDKTSDISTSMNSNSNDDKFQKTRLPSLINEMLEQEKQQEKQQAKQLEGSSTASRN
ncbi:MAG: hypothetical protein ACO2ZM_02500 [Francisellaceae bacterium]